MTSNGDVCVLLMVSHFEVKQIIMAILYSPDDIVAIIVPVRVRYQ